MNRLLVDEGLEFVSRKDYTLYVDIKEDMNLLITDSAYNYEINVNNSFVNILTVFQNSNDLNIKINIDNSKVVYNLISYNGKKENIEVNLNTSNSSFNMYNSVISASKQEIDVNILHNASLTNSNIYNCASTIKEGSVKFNIISKVYKNCIKCNVNQESKIISLNSSNDNEINPNLLIDCYDTLASHSAFIGKFKDDDVFYMQTRGIKKKDAYNLLLEGFLIGKLDVSSSEKEYLKEKLNRNWR